MQKLSKRTNTYTPTDAPQVCSNCDSVLNISEGRGSVQNLKTFDNNSEEDHRKHSSGSVSNESSIIQNIVYVLDIDGNPLMPTNQSKSRRMLKCGKAKVVRKRPFTIQLTYQSTHYKQDIKLGIDTGYENIGLSANTKKKETYASEVKLRTNMSKLISDKSMYRKGRRRKLWYRKPRFLNRGIKKGWLAPSVLHKINSHLNIIKKIHQILPITKIIIETAKFDIQKIKNPDIQGKEYQEGEQSGFNNVKAYVRYRDGHQCRNCNKSKTKLHVHHIESRKTGGDREGNLLTLCKKCHEGYHNGKIKLKIKKVKGYKAETFMSTMRKRLIEELRSKYNDVEETFGYLTKENRLKNKLEKSHVNDAFCIAGGNGQKRSFINNIIQKRKNNRKLQVQRKGFKPSIRKQRYDIQPYDLIQIDGKEYISKGVHGYGKHVYILKNNKKKSISVKKVEKVFHTRTLVYI